MPPRAEPRIEPSARDLPAITGSITPAPQAPATSAAPAGGVTLATRSTFGVDLGVEGNLQLARQRWQRAVDRHGGLVSTLDPIVVVREGEGGRVVLHVVAGPLSDLQEAAVLCARLRSSGTTCAPAAYEGQRLTQR